MKVRVALFGLLAIALCGVVWLILRKPPEPVYQGKTLSQWLEDVDTNQYSIGGEPNRNFGIGVEVGHMGTNAIPFLLRMVGAHDSVLKLKLMGLLEKQKFIKIKSENAYSRILKGCVGLKGLGSNAITAVPQLISIYNEPSSDTDNKLAVIGCLCQIGQPAKEAVTVFVSGMTNADPGVRNSALMGFFFIQSQPELAVPALVRVLNGTNLFDRPYAACALGDYGVEARMAVPDLIRALTNVAPEDRGYVANSLKQIDPEAATKAGVK